MHTDQVGRDGDLSFSQQACKKTWLSSWCRGGPCCAQYSLALAPSLHEHKTGDWSSCVNARVQKGLLRSHDPPVKQQTIRAEPLLMEAHPLNSRAQEAEADLSEFEVSLVYKVSAGTVRAVA